MNRVVLTRSAAAAEMRRSSLLSALLSRTILVHVSSFNCGRFHLVSSGFEGDAQAWSRLIVMALLCSQAARMLGAMGSP